MTTVQYVRDMQGDVLDLDFDPAIKSVLTRIKSKKRE